MKEKSINRNDLIYIISAFLLGITFLNSQLFAIRSTLTTYIVTAMNICLILANIKIFFKFNFKSILLILILIIFLIIESMINNIAIGRIMVMVNIIFLLSFYKYIKFTELGKKIMSIILLLTYVFFMLKDKTMYNSNNVCLLTYIFLVLLNAFFVNNNSKKVFMIKAIIFIVSLYIIWIFEGRSVIIATLIYLLITIVPYRFFKNKYLINFIIVVFLILSILITYIYVYMWKNQVTFDFIEFSSKSFFSGRQKIWNELIIAFENCNILFGLGNTYTLKYHNTYNPHNSALHILVTYGVVCFGIYFILMYKLLKDMASKVDDKYTRSLFAALIGFLFIGFFEIVVIDASVYIYFSLIILFFYDKYSEWKVIKKEK